MAEMIDAKAAELTATAARTGDNGLAELYRSDAMSLRSVADCLRAGKAQRAVDTAYSLETGCRDHFPEELWKLGVAVGLVEARPNGRRALYVQIAA